MRVSKKGFYGSLLCMLMTAVVLLGAQMQSKKRDVSTLNFAVKSENITEVKPFVIIVPSYNNSEYVEKNLTSILSQNYPNFRVIYINDASTDDTLEKAKAIKERVLTSAKSVDIWNNPSNCGALANTYRACHSCKSNEIVAIVDGDDFLSSDCVIKELNDYYNNPDVWMTYGNYEEVESGQKGPFNKPISLEVLKNGRIKHKGWMTSHLRTFYAGLFKRIPIGDLFYKGAFLPMAGDIATMLPMVEMAREHTFFIQDVLYCYNVLNPRNDHKKSFALQQECEKYIRSKPVHEKLLSSPNEEIALKADDKVDVVVFSYNRPMQLFAFLESLAKRGKNYHAVNIIFRASGGSYLKGYEIVKEAFPEFNYIQQDMKKSKAFEQFKPLVLKYSCDSSKAKYVVFSTDDIVLTDEIDFNDGVLALKETGAHALFYRLGRNITQCYMQKFESGVPPLSPLKGNIFAWEYSTGKGDWAYPLSVDMTLYRKEDIKPELESIAFNHPTELEMYWCKMADPSKIGLCYETSKIVNIPLNVVAENSNPHMNSYTPFQLLTAFLKEKKKFDINIAYHINNNSPHYEVELPVIDR